MNAGAFGHEILEAAREVRALDPQGRWVRLRPEEIARGYRTTSLMHNGMIVTGATFGLSRGDAQAIRGRMTQLRAQRATRIAPNSRCAGSVFKNPKPQAAGQLLEAAGCKGLRVGGAAVSQLHANVIVNEGGATAADVITLMREMRGRVRERFGVELEPEVILKGVSL